MESRSLSRQESVFVTVAYADIFSYPLTRSELREWSMFYSTSRFSLPKKVEEYGGFIVLSGRRPIIAKRLAQHTWQEEKWRIAHRAAHWLGRIPTMKLVGVTGGLAMNNAAEHDDVDLFCIVSTGSLWISRLLATMMMDMLGLRRHPGDVHVTNKVCLNMFMTEDGMTIPPSEQDCFTAHEVLQMHPIWEERGTYKNFLRANAWTRQFLPNAWKNKNQGIEMAVHERRVPIRVWFLRLCEYPCKYLQLVYMRRHRTQEVLTDTILRFHPKDARIWIKQKLSIRLKKHKIPLDKVFWAN